MFSFRHYQRVVNLIVVVALLGTLYPAPLWLPAAAAAAPPLVAADAPPPLLPPASAESIPPLTVARVQSAYTRADAVDDAVTVTFAVSNRLAPSSAPPVTVGAALTDTVDLLAAFDYSADINTVRSAILTDELAAGVELLAASAPYQRSGQTVTFNLGHIPPATTVPVTVTLGVAAVAPGLTALDGGAAVYGNWQGNAVNAATFPAQFQPDSFAAWLIATPDANLYDDALLLALAELGGDPQTLFDHVRAFTFHAYTGSLRGTRGTLWSGAGNSVDQSSVLIALLRAAGIPARYRHGTLASAEAQTLIAAMFPERTRTVGIVPDDVPVADPVNDPALIAEVSDHWWVEAYLPSLGWTDLDPSFAAATFGDQFVQTVATDGTDRSAELPDSVRHKVGVTLEVEHYFEFPLLGTQLERSVPLSATLNTVELAGQPLNVHHIVTSEALGFVLNQVEHAYTPVLTLGQAQRTVALGTTYQELLTSIPLASYFLTGIWLTLTETAPGGAPTAYTRTIKDVIGPDVRLNGSALTLPPRTGDAPFIQQGEITQIHSVVQSMTPPAVLEPAMGNLIALSGAVADAQIDSRDLDLGDPAAVSDWFDTHGDDLLAVHMGYFDLLAAILQVTTTSELRPGGRDNLQAVSYPDSPKLLIINRTAYDGVANTSFELLDIRQRTIAAPGQDASVVPAANMLRTMAEKEVEVNIMQALIGAEVTSAFVTLRAAEAQGMPLVYVTPVNPQTVATLAISADAKARIAQAVSAGNSVMVPAEPVPLPGGPATGWLEIDPDGNVAFVSEDGSRAAEAAQYSLFNGFGYIAADGAAVIGGIVATLVNFVVELLEIITGLPCIPTPGPSAPICFAFGVAGFFTPETLLAALLSALLDAAASAAVECLVLIEFVAQCEAGVLLASAFLLSLIVMYAGTNDPSLVSGFYDPAPEIEIPTPAVVRPLAVSANAAAGTVTVVAATPLLAIDGVQTHTAGGNLATAFGPAALATGAGVLREPDGTLVASGALAGSAESVTVSHNPLDLTVSGDGSVATFAAAGSGLRGGAAWRDATATLSAAQPFTATLSGAAVTADATWRGDFTLRADDALSVSGSGSALPLPFDAAAAVAVSAADVLVGANSGGITVGGVPLAAPHGAAFFGVTTTIAVAEQAATVDSVQFSAPADYVTLNLDSAGATVPAGGSVALAAAVTTTFDDTFVVAVTTPPGWGSAIDLAAGVTLTIPVTTAPDTYSVWVALQPAANPAMVVSAEFPVTVTPVSALELAVEPLPLTTVPMGTVRDPLATLRGAAGHLANGRAEVPDAAWEIIIGNRAAAAHTYSVSVTGFPAGWMALSDDEMTLQPGKTGVTGLYLIPPPGAILPPGTSYSGLVTVTALDDGALSDTLPLTFVMPGLAFPYPQAPTAELITVAGATADIDFTVTNVGNVAGSFPLTATLFTTLFDQRPFTPTQITAGATGTTPLLAPGDSATHTVALDLADVSAGRRYFLLVTTPAGEFRPQAATTVRVASPNAAPLLEGGQTISSCSDDTVLAAAFTQVAETVDTLETACLAGSCSSAQRDAVVAAAGALVATVNAAYAGLDTTPVSTAAGVLALADTVQENLDAIPDVSSSVAALVAPLCAIATTQPALQWVPAYAAALTGDSADFTLHLTNQGTLTATYALTVSLPGGPFAAAPTVAPGATVPFTFPLSAPTPQLLSVSATAVADGAPLSRATAGATLNVVDQFLQVTAVTPDPDFVETGTSATTVQVAVTNFANVPLATDAQVTVQASGGGVVASAEFPLLVRPGNPQRYDVTTLDTSGYAAGVYTVTVGLVDSADTPFDGGSGFGYLGVGQALGAGHAVQPAVVAPGAVTVTTVITTEVLVETTAAGQPPRATTNPSAPIPPLSTSAVQPATSEQPAAPQPATTDAAPSPAPHSPLPNTPASPPAGYTRTEGNDTGAISYSAGWSSVAFTPASSGNTQRSSNPGNTASFTFSGTWVNIGLSTSSDSGAVELFLDGVSQGVIDLYSNRNSSRDVILGGLPDVSHTVSLTTLTALNPLSTGNRVQLDFIDTWDGTPLPNGALEQDSGDFLYSNNWSTAVNGGANASGGTYARSDNGIVWLPFAGDSVSIDAYRYDPAGPVDIFIDDVFRARVDLYSPFATPFPIEETISFSGLGTGLHLLRIRQVAGQATLDRVTTPAFSADYTPPVQTGIARLEEFDPGVRYNGLPLTATVGTWSVTTSAVASRGDAAYNGNVIGHTVSYPFSGDGVVLGLVGDDLGGQVEVAIDGVVQETVDTYRRVDQPITRFYSGAGAGAHTLTLTVLPTTNPNSGQNRLYFDYVETWDGSAEPDGTFEADLLDVDRLRYSDNWSIINDANAAGGSYARSSNGAAWFHFTGDSVTYEAFAYSGAGLADVWIDGVLVATLDLRSAVDISRTLTVDGLGAGPHVVMVWPQRGIATVDRFHAPAIEPATVLPVCGAYCRHEENDPALLFNGDPLPVAADSFSVNALSRAGDGHYVATQTVGDSVSLAFTGAAAAVGFIGHEQGGIVEVVIDGVLVDTVDTFRTDDAPFARVYPLADGPHTLAVTLTAGQHPNASDNRLWLDFIDTWDGTPLPGGTQEAELTAYTSGDWTPTSDAVAAGGSYLASDSEWHTIWLPFTGDSVQFDAVARDVGDPWARVTVDGVAQPFVNLWHDVPEVRTFAFDGFGPGVHLLQLTGERWRLGVDTVTAPATQPAHTNAPATGLVRYEERDLLYDGYPWAQRDTAWSRLLDSSGGLLTVGYSAFEAVRTGSAGRSAELTFTGSWANVGLRQFVSGGSAEIWLDGALLTTVDLDQSTSLIVETPFAVITGTHTVSVSVVGDGQVTVDFIDVWDGGAVADSAVDLWLGDDEPRVHFSHAFDGERDANATGGRFMSGGRNVWHTFVGDSVTFYAFPTGLSRNLDVYIDGQFVENVSVQYDFTLTPLAFHYSGLGGGAHTIRVQNGSTMRADGFVTPATGVAFRPIVEWYGDEADGNALSCGICSGITAGDINDDGVVEIIFGSETGSGNELFVYRGDGADTGDGDAVIWRDAYGSGEIGTPALGELDPAYPGTEIVVLSNASLRVYHADGTLWWEDTSIQMYDYIGAPALGNLDADPEPEIVVNAEEAIVVLDADGTQLWSLTHETRTSMPILADFTGDGVLDIVYSEYGKTTFPTKPSFTYLYDFNYGAPDLLWTYSVSTTMVDLFGSHAVADIDGLQPGGDDGPEIALSYNGYLTALDADGSELWTTALDPGAPGGVSIADLDGDGEIEIVTGMRHEFEPGRFGKLYAVNADGSLLWDVVAEDSTSANSSTALDLDGDGIYEVAWNGLEQGFTIFDGLDGSILYNEPDIRTRSGTDHPIIADVDGDGSAEIVIATQLDGVVVLGFDGIWGIARALWNQHTYHITNVNDDLTIPANEPDSWAVHNTYKTQYPDAVVLPVFGVTVSHTVGSDQLAVVGFSVPPDVAADPAYAWSYVQTTASTTVTRTLDVALSGLAPGATRLVAAGTTIDYTLGSGQNRLTLPPLYVTAARLVALEPFSRTVGAGSTAHFTLTLTNPAPVSVTYDLGLTALAAFATLPESVSVPGGGSVAVPLTIATTPETVGTFDLAVTADSGSALDSAVGRLVVVDALDLTLTPGVQSAEPGQSRPYTLTVVNHLPTPQTVALSAAGAPAVSLPADVLVPGGGSAAVTVSAVGYSAGQLPFVVTGTSGDGAADSAGAVLTLAAGQGVSVALAPDPVAAGPAMPAVVTATVTNTGGRVETFDVTVDVPPGWLAQPSQTSVTLLPAPYNATTVRLLITPPAGTAPGSYPYTVTAAAGASVLSDQPASAAADGTVAVGIHGVTVAVDPPSRTLLPGDTPTWTVVVTNTGAAPQTFDLAATGIVALGATFTPAAVALNPGQAATVQLSAGPFPYALPQTYPFAVSATAQGDSSVRNVARASVTFAAAEGVVVGWAPVTQTVAVGETATFVLTITNTGNVATSYAVTVDPLGQPVALTGVPEVVTLPARTVAQRVVTAQAPMGVYWLTGSAESGAGTSADATAQLNVGVPTAVGLGRVAVGGDAPGGLTAWMVLALATGLWLWHRRSAPTGAGRSGRGMTRRQRRAPRE